MQLFRLLLVGCLFTWNGNGAVGQETTDPNPPQQKVDLRHKTSVIDPQLLQNFIKQIAKGELDATSKEFEELLRKEPNWDYRLVVHLELMKAYEKAENRVKAGEHAQAALNIHLESVERQPELLGRLVPRISKALIGAGKEALAAAQVTKALDDLCSTVASSEDRWVKAQISKVRSLVALSQNSAAGASLKKLEEETRAAHDAEPTATSALLHRLDALEVAIECDQLSVEGQTASWKAEYQKLFAVAMSKAPEDFAILERVAKAEISTLRKDAAKDGRGEPSRVANLKSLLESASPTDQGQKNRLKLLQRQFQQIENRAQALKTNE